MNDAREHNHFKKPISRRLRSWLSSYLVSSIIGFTCGLFYVTVYSLQFYGTEKIFWGIGQAVMPESEVKEKLAKLQSELHHANGKLSDLTNAIASARKLGSSNTSDARARLANPRVALETARDSKSKVKPKSPVAAAAQGGGEDETVSVLDALLFRLQSVQANSESPESKNYSSFIESTPIGVPVSGELTSEFGFRVSPFSGFRQAHKGMDVGMNRGAELFATANGTVEVAGWGGAYGNYIIIDHGMGPDGSRFETLYAHLSKIYVKPGVQLLRGEKLGQVGTTGHSTGPHVHYEVRKNGVAVDPAPFVQLASLLDAG